MGYKKAEIVEIHWPGILLVADVQSAHAPPAKLIGAAPTPNQIDMKDRGGYPEIGNSGTRSNKTNLPRTDQVISGPQKHQLHAGGLERTPHIN